MTNPDPWTHVKDVGCRCLSCQHIDEFWTKVRNAWIRKMDEYCYRILADGGLLSEADHVTRYGIPGGYWYCTSCGGMQAGDVPKIAGYEVPRCVACGPGEGFAPCPATHGEKLCVLCGGSGWVEELV